MVKNAIYENNATPPAKIKDTPISDQLYLTTDDAAQLLSLSPRTMERLRVNGGGPRFYKAGPGKRSRVLYGKSDLIDWLSQRSFDNTSQYDN
ncbi:MAG: hypothetical protein DHS20C08_11620 [Rhodomicrobium sp.]|nr:MAG: hypothetical protein DHS20C08_11620 [Rhodomicrobium sp.]